MESLSLSTFKGKNNEDHRKNQMDVTQKMNRYIFTVFDVCAMMGNFRWIFESVLELNCKNLKLFPSVVVLP